jgi:hypothetical protein
MRIGPNLDPSLVFAPDSPAHATGQELYFRPSRAEASRELRRRKVAFSPKWRIGGDRAPTESFIPKERVHGDIRPH